MTIHVDVIRDTDIDAFSEEFLKTPAAVIDQLMQTFVRQFEDITERTGQVIDAGGRPLDFDQWLATLETWDLRFDEAGNPDLDNMILLAGPGVQISPPQPASPEQEQRFAELIQRKRAAYNAAKRTRRLY